MRQDIKNDLYRPLAYNALSAAISDNGELLTWQHKITGPAILERFIPFERLVLWSKGKTSLDGAEELRYSIANFKCTYARVVANAVFAATGQPIRKLPVNV